MIRIDWYVADNEQNDDRLDQALKDISESFGGVTVTRTTGGWVNPANYRLMLESAYVFTALADDPMAAETRARMMSDRLLDIFDREQEVMFTVSPMMGDTVRRTPIGRRNCPTTGDRHCRLDGRDPEVTDDVGD